MLKRKVNFTHSFYLILFNYIKMKVFRYSFIIFIFTSCSAQHKKDCYNTQLDSLKAKAIYGEVKSKALDSLQSWINSGITASGIPPLRNRLKWKIDDAIFFNQKQTRVIFMILERDTVLGSKADYIDFFIGLKAKQDWCFYFKSVPSMYIARKLDNESTPHSFEELSAIGVEQVLKEYYKSGTCIIKDSFFDYDIKELQEQHKKFLNEK
jgi:hypothetical protein